jgi:hypothetical protein
MSANYFLGERPLKLVGILPSLRIDHLLVYFEKKNRTGAEAMEFLLDHRRVRGDLTLVTALLKTRGHALSPKQQGGRAFSI